MYWNFQIWQFSPIPEHLSDPLVYVHNLNEVIWCRFDQYIDLFGTTLWPWHVWWIRQFGTHHWLPWHQRNFGRPRDWFGKFVGDSGQYLSCQRLQWAGEAKFTANKAKSHFLAPNLAQTSNHDQLCFRQRSLMCDIDHISASVGPPVRCDYRIDRNGTVYCTTFGLPLPQAS